MKKTVLGLLAVVLCMLCATAVWAAETGLPESCPHCGTAVTWQPLSEPANNNTLTEGHYYVTKSLSGKAWYTEGKVCLYMNGQTVNSSNRVFYINEGSELNLLGTGSAIGNAYASGSTAGGGVVYLKGTLNLDGPTIRSAGKAGRTAKSGGVVYLTGGTLNMYSGTISGGHATNGGTMYLLGESTANIYGGTISGGQATSTGGAVYLTNSTLNLHGGTIIGGQAGSNGGGLYMAENSIANLYGGMLTGGTATTNGGGIYLKAKSSLNIAGAQIVGGECGNSGGSIYAAAESRTVMSAGGISGGKAGSNGGCIYLYTDGIMDMSGGTVGDGAEGTYATGSSLYVRTGGIVNLSGNASIHELRYPSLSAKTLGISGSYTGTVTLKANAYPDGQVVGPAKDTDLTNAEITVGDGSYYLVVKNSELRLSRLGELDPKTLQSGYCEACQKNVQWILLDAEDCTAGKRILTGHYRINAEDCYLGQKTIGGTDRVCIDLNGKTLHADRAFDVNTGILNLVDTVGGGEIIGQGSNVTDASYGGVGYVRQNGEMNIYGGTFSYREPTDNRHYINRGGIFYVQGKLNLYGGEILGGAALTGSAIFGNAGAEYCSQLGFYGGTVTMGQSIPNGTSTGLCVMTRGTVSVGGDCRVDELLVEKATGSPVLADMLKVEDDFSGSIRLQLPSFAGCTDIGSCVSAPQNITLGNDSTAEFMCLDGQLLVVSGAPKVIIYHENGSATAYETLAAAIGDSQVTDRLILIADNGEDVSVDKLVHLDLNGFDLTGTVSGSGTLACMDLKTADFTVADGDYGKITGTVSCALTGVTVAAPCSDDQYLMITEQSGISFHRICLQITNSVLRPADAGIYYSSNFAGDELVAGLVSSFGIALNTSEMPTVENMETTTLYTVMDKARFNSDSTSCLLSGIMKTECGDGDNLSRSAMPVYAGAYVRLTDGTVLFGSTVSTSLQEQAAAINANWINLKFSQKRAFVAMFERFDTVMRDSAWSVSTAITIADRKVAFASTDYTPYLAPWTHDVVAEARADGKIHYYFMAGEGMLISESQGYKDKWGDSCLIVFPNGQTMLIDAGPFAYAPVLAQNLERMGITHLDALLITHPHSDHQYGAFSDSAMLCVGLLDTVTVDKVYYRGGYDPTTTGSTLVARVCADLGIPYAAISKGDVLQFGDVRMECVWPMPGDGDGLIVGGEEINNTSVVTRFDYGEHSSLFTADIYTSGEKMILEQVDNSLLDVDFLKVPHHGYNTSSSFEFIDAVSPEVAMATGRLPIPASVRSRYEDTGVTFLDDRSNGYVEVTGSADGTLEYVVSRTEATDDTPEAGDDVTPDGSED